MARLGSISAAARKLGWTQPALGQQLRRLEREAGTALVSRNTQGVTLTPAGTALLGHADAIANQLIVAQAAMRDSRRTRASRLHIASFATATSGMLAQAVSRIAAEHHDLTLKILEMDPRQAVEALRDGQVDGALVYDYPVGRNASHHDKTSQRTEIIRDPLKVLLPPSHRLNTGRQGARPLSVRLLAREPWVSETPWHSELLTRYGTANGFHPDIRYTATDQIALQQLVASGLGVALASEMTLRTYCHPGLTARDIAEQPFQVVELITRAADPRPILPTLVTQLRLAAKPAVDPAGD